MTAPHEAARPAPSPPGNGAAAGLRYDVLALAALGLVLGLAARGHFALPHADFPDFVDSGRALWRGQLPPTLTRAPVYPLLVVGLGRLLPGEMPALAAAEWLSALLLPLNGVLVYLLARPLVGGPARWAAVWFLLLPTGLYCTAHVLLEPLLITGLLLTLLAAGRRPAWVGAALTTMVRYDAAGVIPGLALAGLHRRAGGRRVLLRSALAAAPLGAWLLLTALTWRPGWRDHYLAQIAERPVFDLAAAAGAVLDSVLPPALLEPPGWLGVPRGLAAGTLRAAAILLIALGLVARLRARDAAAITGLVTLAGYVIVHALYAYQVERYGYPPAPLVLVWAAAGVRELGRWAGARLPAGARHWLLLALALLVLAGLVAAAAPLAAAVGAPHSLAGRAALLALVAVVAVWAAAGSRRPASLTLLLAAVLLLARQLGTASAALGTGQDMRNVVAAARWVRDHVPPDAGVLSAQPALLRLVCGAEPAGRFLSFEDIGGTAWEEVLDECRRRGVAYIIWHDRLAEMHGAYYGDRLGLERFAPLTDARRAPGVQPERWFTRYPNLVIVRVLPAGPATRPG